MRVPDNYKVSTDPLVVHKPLEKLGLLKTRGYRLDSVLGQIYIKPQKPTIIEWLR